MARNDLAQARTLLTSARSKDRRNPRYIVALSRLALRQDSNSAEALKILDEAEKEFGVSRELQFARLLYWSVQKGDRAKAEVAKLAEARTQVPVAEQPAYLDQLGQAELRLGDTRLARQYWGELAVLQPENLQVLLTLFDLAIDGGDEAEANSLIDRIFKVENPRIEGDSQGQDANGYVLEICSSRLLDQPGDQAEEQG